MIKQKFKTSIVVVNWNRKEDVLLTIEQFYNEIDASVEVVIVDNGSTDGSPDAFKFQYPKVKLVKVPLNLGCEDGFNTGILNSEGEFIIFLDSDASITFDNICRMIDIFEADSSVGIVEPKIYDIDGQLTNRPKNWPQENYFTGCAVGFRRAVFECVGLRPGRYFIYSSEPYLSIKVVDGGFKIINADDISATHRISTVSRNSKSYYYFVTRNCIWLILELYPLKLIPYEFVCVILHNFILSIRDSAFLPFLKGVGAGLIGGVGIFCFSRRPTKNAQKARIYPPFSKVVKIVFGEIL